MGKRRKWHRIKDKYLIGKRFGELQINSLEVRNSGKESVRWATCTCTCGNKTTLRLSNIIRPYKATKACGCKRKYLSGMGARNRVCATYRKNAAKRNQPCLLNNEQMIILFESPCSYCGLPPSNVCTVSGGNGSYTYSGIDRIDNKKGYTVQNSVSCCRECNFAKRGFSRPVFLAMAIRIANYQKSLETTNNPIDIS